MILLWMAAAQLTEKFEWVNQKVEEATKVRDTKLLKEMHQLHARLRYVSESSQFMQEIDISFKTLSHLFYVMYSLWRD